MKYDYLFNVDPVAKMAYGLYKASNENKGSFMDFLLKYDTKKANNGDFASILGDNKFASSLMQNYSFKADDIQKPYSLLNLNSTNYELLAYRSNEIVKTAINSENLTKEQKQFLAQKYKELSEL